jgi:hypothetical protein
MASRILSTVRLFLKPRLPISDFLSLSPLSEFDFLWASEFKQDRSMEIEFSLYPPHANANNSFMISIHRFFTFGPTKRLRTTEISVCPRASAEAPIQN